MRQLCGAVKVFAAPQREETYPALNTEHLLQQKILVAVRHSLGDLWRNFGYTRRELLVAIVLCDLERERVILRKRNDVLVSDVTKGAYWLS